MVSPHNIPTQNRFPLDGALPWGHLVGELVYDFGDTLIYEGTNENGDSLWLWEAVPQGAKRSTDGTWTSAQLKPHELRVLAWDDLLRWQTGGSLAGVPVTGARVHGNTVWAESEPLTGWIPLAYSPDPLGSWPETGALGDVLKRLLIGLDAWHSRGLIHAGVTAARTWLNADGTVFLAPGGHRRVWEADRFSTEETGGPPELRDPRAALTRAFDLFCLAELLRGHPEAQSGTIATLFEECLTQSPHTRPQDAAEALRHLRAAYVPEAPRSWQELDAVRAAVQSLRYARRECPVCRGPMEEPRPLKKERCPVCQRGVIRDIRPRKGICPECHVGSLQMLGPGKKSLPCPACPDGRMLKVRKTWKCQLCEHVGDPLPENDRTIQYCALCDAVFSKQIGGLWFSHNSSRYMSDEELLWASLRGGPGQTPHQCDACEAGYLAAADHVTLIAIPPLAEGFFVEGYRGRAFESGELGWVAVGQTSLAEGFICPRGDVEFDGKAGRWELVRTSHLPLAEHVGEINSPEDWHRLARGLPIVAEEEAFEVRFERALRMAYRLGEIGLDGNPNNVLWNSPVVLEDGRKHRRGHLRVTPDSLAFRAAFRRQGSSLAALASVVADGNRIRFSWRETTDEWNFVLPEYHWTVQTKSGKTTLTLTATDLAARLSNGA